ncbi:hypothetical protein ACKUB1_02120 [Methanospirillum stamsii]|uniref:Uncharacterized protein n=1 Tax=Methanospirillum stamsii TaxID=1277351 RepID=A0A2V2MRG4_9EURY|nr:hypothetical protein [Methanospirillum stamsii]PWR70824.1 hypothetical protein DLD82_15155 [Methanospirillum stamsii]
MAVNIGRGVNSDFREQFMTLKVMSSNIKSQEQFLMMVERQDIIPDMARRLSREAVGSDLQSNKRVLLDFLYNMLARSENQDLNLDVEFHYIMIGKEFLEVDKSILWMEDIELPIPYEIGDKLGKVMVGEDTTEPVKKILAFYKAAEARFDREHFGNLDRCSLLILEEHYPQVSWHIRMRLPAKILNDYPVSI